MLQALFDEKSNLVGWIEPDKHIFDTNMRWVAFIKDDHAWSADTGNWLGPVNDTECMDKNGRVVAWGKDSKPRGRMRPTQPPRVAKAMRPTVPMRQTVPTRPMIPMRPVFGWSNFSFAQWVRQ